MTDQLDHRTSASSSATGPQECGTDHTEQGTITDASRDGQALKSVWIIPTITRTADSFQFRSGVMTNWRNLFAIEGIRERISALPSFTIDNASVLSPEELATELDSKMASIKESGPASKNAFAECIQAVDSQVSVSYVNDAASVDYSQAPQRTVPIEPQQSFDGSIHATDREQDHQIDSLATRDMIPTLDPGGANEVEDERK